MDGCGLKKICFIYRYYHTYLHKFRFVELNRVYHTRQGKNISDRVKFANRKPQSRPVLVLYRPPQKNPQTKWSGDRGGRYRTRTCDLLHVKQMLYQLS